MHWLTPPDTSLQEEVRTTKLVNAELLAIPGVRNAGSHIGNALLGDEPYGVYFGENWISVDKSVDYDATRDRVEDVVNGYPGIHRDVLTYLKERIREVLTGKQRRSPSASLVGDLELLREKATEVRGCWATSRVVIENHVEFQDAFPRSRSRWTWRGSPVRREARGRPASRGLDGRGRGGRRHLPGRPRLRRAAVDPPEDRQSVSDLRASGSTPRQGAGCGSTSWPMSIGGGRT